MFDMIDIVVLILLGILTVPLMLDFLSKFKIRNELLKTILCLLWVILMLFFEIEDLITFLYKIQDCYLLLPY